MYAAVFMSARDECWEQMRLHDLMSVVADGTVYDVDEAITFSTFFIPPEVDLEARLRSFMTDWPHATLIVISDRLTELSQGGVLVPSNLATSIEQLALKFEACGGLVALVDGAVEPPQGIDAIVRSDPLDIRNLRTELIKVANRLWLKCTPERRAESSGEVYVRPVKSRQELRLCLALRRTVYGRLGYLQENVLDAKSDIELDGYDLQAAHFAAIDPAAGNRVVGTLRLILPGLNRDLPGAQAAECAIDYREWCQKIADQEVDRVFRDRVENWATTSLPIFDSFNYLNPFGREVESKLSCEISRVVVEPGYRGKGISRQLMDKAINAASILCRPCLLLECAPHHESMYAKYGFKVLRVEGRPYYARAQRLDQVAVAMCLNLSPANDENADGRHDEKQAATYRLSVTDGPAAGCRLTFESEGMSSDDLRRLIDQPPSASDLGGYAAFHPRPAGLTARGRAPFRSQVLASLGAGTADDVVDCLRQFLRGHDCVTLTIEDQEGRQLRLDGPDTPLGAWQTATEILKNRAER